MSERKINKPKKLLITINRFKPEPTKKLSEFMLTHGLELLLDESNSNRWVAKFHKVEIVGAGVLISDFGEGANPRSAVIAYLNKIRGKTISIGMAGRVDVPKELILDLGPTQGLPSS